MIKKKKISYIIVKEFNGKKKLVKRNIDLWLMLCRKGKTHGGDFPKLIKKVYA